MVTLPARHAQEVMPHGEILYLVRPTNRWRIDRYECRHPLTLSMGFQYVESFMEPWRDLEFTSPEDAKSFVQMLIVEEMIIHN